MENKTIKVSVIVPVYNGEATIARCINSVLRQTLTELELIIIDDGSTDRCEDICRSYDDPRLIYRYKENGGVSTARNLGISIAQGEYIGFVDADDYIAVDMCEKMYHAAAETNADIGICDYDIVFGADRVEHYTDLLRGGFFDKQQIQQEVLPQFLGHVDGTGNIAKFDWAIIRRFFKRDFLTRHSLCFDETLSNSEDCLFAYLATDLAERMVYLKSQQLYINIRNAQSATRQYLPSYWQQRCRIMDELEAVINTSKPAWNQESFPLFVMRCVRPSFTNIGYGFGKVSMFHSLMAFRTIVHDPRVQRMCNAMNTAGLNEEWSKLYSWCKQKRWVTLYLYYMDVQYHNKLCHCIRKIQKTLERRLLRFAK